MKLYKPEPSHLDGLKKQATASQTVEEWRKHLLERTARVIREDPLRYRSFGPYWWIQKKLFLDAGITEFGTNIDKEGFEFADYGSSDYNMLAAWLYQDYALDGGILYAPRHTVPIVSPSGQEETELYEYALADEEMEKLAKSKKASA